MAGGPPNEWTFDSTREWLVAQLKDIAEGIEIDPGVDMFDQGIDRQVVF